MSSEPPKEEEPRAVSSYNSPCGNSACILQETDRDLQGGEVRGVLKAVFGQDFSLDLDVHAARVSESDLEDEEERRVLEAVFGYGSDSDLDKERILSSPECAVQESKMKCRWEMVDEIQGLWLCRDFLTPEQQSRLLVSIDKENWFVKDSHNQAMRFGDLPEWAVSLSNSIRELCLDGWAIEDSKALGICPFPMDLLWREPLFDQLIANVYQPGEGICAHVDLMRFEDGIAIVSLESACVMHFTHVNQQENNANIDERASSVVKIPVFLTPGSLVLMSGEARYDWTHEINRRPGFQVWEGMEIKQEHRTSVTLRKLRQTE